MGERKITHTNGNRSKHKMETSKNYTQNKIKQHGSGMKHRSTMQGGLYSLRNIADLINISYPKTERFRGYSTYK